MWALGAHKLGQEKKTPGYWSNSIQQLTMHQVEWSVECSTWVIQLCSKSTSQYQSFEWNPRQRKMYLVPLF